MNFKKLEWEDIVSNGVLVCSGCKFTLCGWIKIEFRINHEPTENKYYLYSFGKGNIRGLKPDIFITADEAKCAAYKIYNEEMNNIKKKIDFLLD